ncbi:universal stress protein [Variovorax sp. J2P1-59]|uniref:universal stress protein n=1 Tax=Variovorax flavidus TaxID=3053501 RepID=UPI002579220C|nr:universal stress protein [Variovorax sp. J2P1-59]MDM0074713.1 universal stress protein [Variovorax sp. J2P1-59]
MNIRSILAVTDFSKQADWALERAAQLAVEHRATLKLMFAPANGNAPPADGASRLAHTARALSTRLAITVRTANQTANTLHHVAEEAACADLLVLGYQRESALATFLRGQTAERLARLCRCPVLVTKLAPKGRYGRILVAVDFTPESRNMVKLACVLDADAEVELFHAISTLNEARLRCAEASAQAVKAYRQECLRYARHRILALTDSFDSRRNRVMSKVSHGDPARQAAIQQEYVGADLLVVGKRRRLPFMTFFLGSVSQRVLYWATSDVLIVPHDAQASTRVAAIQRMEAEMGDAKGAFRRLKGRPTRAALALK